MKHSILNLKGVKELNKNELQSIKGESGLCPSETTRCICPSGFSFCTSSIGSCVLRCGWDPTPNN